MPSIRFKNPRLVGSTKGEYGSKRPSSASNPRSRNKKRAVSPAVALPAEEAMNVIVEDGEDDPGEPPSAYDTLLQSLQADGGSFAEAYSRRQRNEQGASNSEDGDEDNVESKRDDVELDEGAEKDEAAGENLKHQSLGDGEEGGSGTQPILKYKQCGAEDEEDNDQEIQESMSGHDAASNRDPFKLHLDHVVSKAEIATLQSKHVFVEELSMAGLHGGQWITTKSQPTVLVEKSLVNCAVKQRLRKRWDELHNQAHWGDFSSDEQCQFFSLCRSYRDIFHSRHSAYPAASEDLSIMDAYLLHVLNHVLKTKDLVTKNNDKLQTQANDGQNDDHMLEAPRDQGFTRPKVLILLPLRSTALKLVSRLLELAPLSQKTSIEHKQRFFDDFGAEEVEPENMDEHQKQIQAKPADFRALFSANNDDHFRIGLKFTRKSIKLYSDFYSSDIIIASPIGLVTKIGEAESEKGTDIDFLSSIEILVVDYIDVILMQNWSHVVSIFDHVNKVPKQQHGVDMLRVREWYLNGQAQHYRQTILLAPFADAGANALFHRACVNHAGKVKLRSIYTGVLSNVLLQVRQVYERINCRDITEVDSARFEFFVKQVFPRIKDQLQGGVMLFVRSYFDFVRLRNFLKSQEASFCLLGEYTKQSDISRGRAWFFHGKRKIMLYTERAHFYHRFKIRGIRELIFYSLPDNARFYFEMLNVLEGLESPSCTVLFSRFDNLQLERIVGSSRSQKLLASSNQMFMFC